MAGYLVAISGVANAPQPDSVRVAWEINAGWTAELTYATNPPMDMADDATVVISMTDDLGSALSTPPLRILERNERDELGGKSGGYSLIDETSVKLTDGTQSFDTFETSTSTAIVAAIASRFGVSVSGVENFVVWKEDIKLSDGWTPLRRLAAVAGQQLIVQPDGSIVYRDAAWTAGSSSFKESSRSRTYKPQLIYGAIYADKNMGTGTASGEQYYDFDTPGFVSGQALTAPLSVTGVFDSSEHGRITWVSFFDSSDQLCGQWPLGGGDDVVSDPIVGDWPAVKFTCVVEPSTASGLTATRVRIVGTPENPPPSGIDPAFGQLFGTGRGYPNPFSESLIPSLSFAASHYPAWLAEINRGTNQIIGSAGHLDLSVRLGQTWSAFGQSGRIEKIEWAGTPSSQSTTITAEVV